MTPLQFVSGQYQQEDNSENWHPARAATEQHSVAYCAGTDVYSDALRCPHLDRVVPQLVGALIPGPDWPHDIQPCHWQRCHNCVRCRRLAGRGAVGVVIGPIHPLRTCKYACDGKLHIPLISVVASHSSGTIDWDRSLLPSRIDKNRKWWLVQQWRPVMYHWKYT